MIEKNPPLETAAKALKRAGFRLHLISLSDDRLRVKDCAAKWSVQAYDASKTCAEAAKTDPAREAYAMRDLHIYASDLIGHELDKAIALVRILVRGLEGEPLPVDALDQAKAWLKEQDDIDAGK